MTTIEKIKAEIERQKEINKRLLDGQLRDGCLYAYNQVRSFLSTLEEPEKPSEWLEEEIKSWIPPIKVKVDEDVRGMMKHIREWGELIARHFAKWGAERQKEQDDRFVDIIYQEGIEKGKDDMKEQMLKEEKK